MQVNHEAFGDSKIPRAKPFPKGKAFGQIPRLRDSEIPPLGEDYEIPRFPDFKGEAFP